MKKVIWYTGTEKNTAVQAIESGVTINACNKDSHRKLW